MVTIREHAESRLREGVRAQNDLYDEIVLPALGSDDEVFQKAYQKYQEKLNGFDIIAFRKCVKTLVDDTKDNNPELFNLFIDKFSYIGQYIVHRNCFEDKIDDILAVDGSNDDKQHLIDALDRKRTNAHNGVIDLFNSLNEYADKKNITRPYPNSGQPFNKKNYGDRAYVADIFSRQEPILSAVNLLMEQERTMESPEAKMRTMGCLSLYKYGKELEEKVKKNDENMMIM